MCPSLIGIHSDPLEHRRPLTVVTSDAQCAINADKIPFDHRAQIRVGKDRWLTIRLATDSFHLSHFFACQWGDSPEAVPDATIFALKEQPEQYNLPSRLANQRTWFRGRAELWQFGTEYYGNIKVGVRGICSAIAEADELFLHGCSLRMGGRGLILCGISGAGKTTLAAALRTVGGKDIKVINDDWGAISLKTGMAYYTGEKSLHMKYRSVSVLSPDFLPDPSRYATENYDGNRQDPHARLLVPREDVFGLDGVADESKLMAYIVVFRDLSEKPMLRPLVAKDFDRIEFGQRSSFYDRHERFLDGSLFLHSINDINIHRGKLERLVTTVPVAWVVNNAGAVENLARRIIDSIMEAR